MALIFGVLLLITSIYVFSKSPSHDKDWQIPQQRLPEIRYDDSSFTINGIRDFRYGGRGSITEQNYLEKQYNFADVQHIWYGLSHFGPSGAGLAHVFLSFEFVDDAGNPDFLVLSIEARRSKKQAYSPLLGVLRHYEIIYIWGTERDVIGVRSHVREEKTQLYKLNTSRENTIRLLQSYLEDSAELIDEPAFYNTLLNNCMLGLIRHGENFSLFEALTTRNIILPGFSDYVLFEKGFLDSKADFSTQRQASFINIGKSAITDSNFSERIRQ